VENIAYSPEKFGLTVFVEIEALGGYEFDTFIIWKDKIGLYYWADDSGCSCPTPFDGVTKENASQGTLRDAFTDLIAWTKRDKYMVDDRTKASKSAIDKISKELVK
jgi:hypothetical protein